MDRYKITIETWNKVAKVYEDKFMNLVLYNDSYDLFCRLLDKRDPDILEIGCGPGNITRYLVSQRPDFKITAIDVSPNMITLAKINNPTVDCIRMDGRDIQGITGKFDGIVCGFCIPYLSMPDSTRLLTDSYHLLRDKGILYFSTIKGDYQQSGFETGSTGDQCYVYYYDEKHFNNELREIGFTLVDILEVDFPRSDGTCQVNQLFIARKNENS
jgi:2-polyprenyl-3-methyl-5-hydroxy-6-metoxy-1,4-benzoquinol methylase